MNKGTIAKMMVNFHPRCCGVILAATFLAMSIPGWSLAQRRPAMPDSETEYDRCSSTGEAARGVMPAIYDCQRAELDRVDAELNRIYRQLRQRLPAARFSQLRIEQRAWLKRLEPGCLKESRKRGGEGTQDEQFFWLGCLIQETGGRAAELEAMLPRRR